MNQAHTLPENFFLSPLLQPGKEDSPYFSPFAMPECLDHIPDDDIADFQLEESPCLRYHATSSRGKFTEVEEQELQEVEEEGSSEEKSPSGTPNEAPDIHRAHQRQEQQLSLLLPRTAGESEGDVLAMIEFLIEHSHLKEEALEAQGRRLTRNDAGMLQAFRVLAGKFRRLRKTKEEMTKYCLRKAFKFIAGRRSSPPRDLDHCMRQYFEDAGGSFSIPFKKHSADKTMNANFLKRIFACEQFTQDYRGFLEHFRPMVIEDNSKKVKYLAEQVEEALVRNQIDAVSKIKRLPWTTAILEQVLQLAAAMPDGQQMTSPRHPRRRPSQ